MAENTDKKVSSKTKMWIIGISLLLILIIGIVIFRAGRKKGSINLSTPVVDNPTDPTGNTNPFTSTSDIQKLAGEVEREMAGGNVYHDTDLWRDRVLTLSDTDFVRLNNEFNNAYQKESGETFRQWVEGEVHYFLPFVDTNWETIKKSLLIRFDNLNLA